MGNVSIYACKAAYPVAGTGTTNVRRLGGQERQFPLADHCLGGYFFDLAVQPERYLPLVQGYEPQAQPDTAFALHRIFRDVTNTERVAGITLYRGAFFRLRTAGTWTMHINKALGAGTVTVGAEAVAQDTVSGNYYVQRIANEQTAPAGVVFTAPSSGSPLSLGTTTTESLVFVWMKVVISAGATATMYDTFDLAFTRNGTVDTTFHFFHSLYADISTATISGARDGEVISLPQGETFTVTTANSSGTATDPPSQVVMMTAASSWTSPHLQEGVVGHQISGSWVAPCNRTAQGVYQVQFRPPVPGHYQLTFDCGGQLFATRSVEVSPVP